MMALRDFEVDGNKVLIDDEMDANSTGDYINNGRVNEEFENTVEIEPISEDDKLAETLTNVFGDANDF